MTIFNKLMNNYFKIIVLLVFFNCHLFCKAEESEYKQRLQPQADLQILKQSIESKKKEILIKKNNKSILVTYTIIETIDTSQENQKEIRRDSRMSYYKYYTSEKISEKDRLKKEFIQKKDTLFFKIGIGGLMCDNYFYQIDIIKDTIVFSQCVESCRKCHGSYHVEGYIKGLPQGHYFIQKRQKRYMVINGKEVIFSPAFYTYKIPITIN